MTDKFEEYIEAIHEIMEETGEDHAHTTEIAERLGNSPASVTEMLGKLSEKGLVMYRAYYGASLTKKGLALAKQLEKVHGTIYRFLEMIGVPAKDAERDACQIEHHMARSTRARFASFVEHLDGTEPGREFLRGFMRKGS